MLPLFTLLHPLVDALSVAIVLCTASDGWAFLCYNFCAFALQFPLGLLLDRFPRCVRAAFAGGVLLLAAGTVLRLTTWWEYPPIVVACVGNALFHLSAGKLILDRTDGRAGPIGLFISTGAVGLMAGSLLVDSFPRRLSAVLAALIVLLGAVAFRRVSFARTRQVAFHGIGVRNVCWIAVLFALVCWRGFVAVSSAGGVDAGGLVLLIAGALVTLVGKIAGGYLADAFGHRVSLVGVSVIGSLLLWFGVGRANPCLWLAIVFVAQLATGPVLSLLTERLNRASGTGFGLNCLGLFFGAL